MTVANLAALDGICALICPDPEREIGGVYIGDLLSWVMGRAKADDAWITIMTNINVVAVAALARSHQGEGAAAAGAFHAAIVSAPGTSSRPMSPRRYIARMPVIGLRYARPRHASGSGAAEICMAG